MADYPETFESGTSGNSVSTASIFGTVNGTLTYDTTHVKAGSLAAHGTGTGSSNGDTGTTLTLNGDTTFLRFYLYLAAWPSADAEFVRVTNGTSARFRARILATGKLQLRQSNTVVATSTGTLPTGQWVRVEIDARATATTLEARYYSGANLEGTTPDETVTYSSYSTTATANRLFLGCATAQTSSWDFWLDDVDINDSAQAGPTGSSTTTVGQTLTPKWNVRAAVGQTLTPKWNVRAAISKTLTANWNVATSVAQTLTANWGVRAAVGKTVQAVWNTRAAVGQALTADWNVRTAVAQTLTTQWNVLTSAARTLTADWNVRAAVGKAVTADWNVRALAAQTLTPQWNVRAAVGQAVTAEWAVRTAVGQALTAVWNVRQAVGQTVTATWNVLSLAALSAVGQTLTANWNVRQAIGQTATAQWNVRATVAQALTPVWNVRQWVSLGGTNLLTANQQDGVSGWSFANAVSSGYNTTTPITGGSSVTATGSGGGDGLRISANFSPVVAGHPYAGRATVRNDSTFSVQVTVYLEFFGPGYLVSQGIGTYTLAAGETRRYAGVVNGHNSATSGKLLVITSGASTATLTVDDAYAWPAPALRTLWNVRTSVGQAVTAKWNVRALAGQNLTPEWNVRALVTNSLNAVWNARQTVGQEATLQWSVRALAGQSLTADWATKSTVGKAITAAWNVLALNVDLPWVLFSSSGSASSRDGASSTASSLDGSQGAAASRDEATTATTNRLEG